MHCREKIDLTLVSPRNYFLYTPLLPQASVGTVEERSIVEPVRKMLGKKVCRGMKDLPAFICPRGEKRGEPWAVSSELKYNAGICWIKVVSKQ